VEWNEDCQEAFDKIKQYLQDPPVLHPPVSGRPLILYLTVLDEFMGYVLGQHDETWKKEHAIYYLSKRFIGCEYSMLERACCALTWATHRLRQYMLSHTTWLISKMDPIKYIFEKPALTGRLALWQMLLSEYDIVYVTQKAVKGSALAENIWLNSPLKIISLCNLNSQIRTFLPYLVKRRVAIMKRLGYYCLMEHQCTWTWNSGSAHLARESLHSDDNKIVL